MTWHHQAACTGVPVAIFYPRAPEGRPPTNGHDDHWQPARTICATCPVQDDCLHDAMTDEAGVGLKYRWGMRGGLTPTERNRLTWRICVECGNRYDITLGNGQPPIYCTETCRRARRDRTIEAQNERAAIERRAANSVDTDCHLCGLMFSTVLGVKQHLRQTHRRAVAA